MTIQTVLVIGAGTMGGGIAAHCANAGLDVTLLDVPATDGDRNAVVKALWARQLNARPAALFSAKTAERVRLGNTTDDIDAAAAQADWIIEAIVEQLEPKRALHARIDAARRPGTIVSSNTSGIPIRTIAEGRSADFQAHFLGTHFFNPPRYLKLLEFIPGANTERAVLDAMTRFAESTLGKSVVLCKDTPNFIANRIGAFVSQVRMLAAIDQGLSIEEVDALTGPLIGSPKTATFRLADLIGLDVLAAVTDNVHALAPQDERRVVFVLPPIMRALLAQKALGNKTGAGFYKAVQTDDGKAFWVLDLASGAYRPPATAHFDLIAATRELPLAERWRAIFERYADDRGGRFLIDTTLQILSYAALRVPEITDAPADIDKAMRLGFGHEMGPFEIWEALGWQRVIDLMRARGLPVAAWVVTGRQRTEDRGQKADHRALSSDLSPLSSVLCRPAPALPANPSAALIDMGDGVLGFAFRGRGNTIDQQVADIGTQALALLAQDDWRGMVIGNTGKDFCLGANINLFQAAADDAKKLDALMSGFQRLIQNLHFSPKPIVAAMHQRALGGGAEMGLLAARIAAAAESYIGLVEFGVGLIPAFGGCKELLRRNVSPHITSDAVNGLPYLQKVFETIAFARVSESAEHARELGFLAASDLTVLNDDRLHSTARRMVLELAETGYRPPQRDAKTIYAIGAKGKAVLYTAIDTLRWSGQFSNYDAHIARQLAHVLCGGDLSAPQWVTEQHILDLERAAFLELVQQPQTQARIVHMLKNGKPLRN